LARKSAIVPGAIVVAVVVLALGLAWLAASWIYVPAWRILVGFQGFWLPLAVLLVGAGILGAVNVPMGLRLHGRSYALNLLAFVAPIAVIVYTAYDIHPPWGWGHVGTWLVCVAAYSVLTRTTEEGVAVPSLLINGLSLGLVLLLHYAFQHPLRVVMWWGFTIQYSSLVLPDVVRGVAQAGRLNRNARVLAIGGAGPKDALWTAPVSALTYAFVAQWILWGGHEPSVFAR